MNLQSDPLKEQTKRVFFNREIAETRLILNHYFAECIKLGFFKRDDLYTSDHLAQRIVERKLQRDVMFICRLTKHFMKSIFYQTTYENRTYVLELKGLKVGISVVIGKITGKRMAILSTAFTTDINYEVDEVIRLK